MPDQEIDTLVVGAGQSGIAMSANLTELGIPHIVLERDRIAEAWRTGRWDSLVANGPAWHDRFAAAQFEDLPPDSFAAKDRVVRYLEDFARRAEAPVQTGVEVTAVTQRAGDQGFRVETSAGVWNAMNVVAATGPFQRPVIPPLVPDLPGVDQIHSQDYRNPDQLAPGAALVIGAGSSGTQIADELARAGRQVYLSVGPHHRPPRTYRGYDYCWWLGVLGEWDRPTLDPATAHITIAVSGAHGGETVDFRALAHRGITLTGMAENCRGGVMRFAPDLAANIAEGDANYLSVLDRADAYVRQHGLDLPQEPEARLIPPDPFCLSDPIMELDLAEAGIKTILWATGYALDFGWLQIDAFRPDGKPDHHRGVSVVPGLYFLGLPWLSRRASSFIYGAWHDARYLADHIAQRRGYLAFPPMSARR